MYPPQTSLISATVALIRFFSENGFASFFQNYPYWYLGSTPFRYLIGPVVPVFEYALRTAFPTVSFFSLTIWLIVASMAVGGFGWLLLITKILKKDEAKIPKSFYFLFLIVYFILPWKYLSGFTLSEGTYMVAEGLIPFVLVSVWIYLLKKDRPSLVVSCLSVALMLLINTNVLFLLIVGTAALCLTVSFKTNRFRHIEKRLKRGFSPVVLGFIVATLWYGPKFWWVQLANPGIGGLAGINVILTLIDFLKNLIPLVAVILVLYFSHKIKSRITIFSLVWLLTFVLLTLYRFMANPAFWMDWTSWLTEVEVGIFLLISAWALPQKVGPVGGSSHSTFLANAAGAQWDSLRPRHPQFFIILFVLPFLATFYVYNSLGKPKILSRYPPAAIYSLGLVGSLPKNSLVFVTGSSTFWLNAFFDVIQVRGGRDEVAIDPNWRTAAYTFRESKDQSLIEDYLKKLNVSFVLVNTAGSHDYYKDYKNVGLWQGIGTNVASENGDYLLKVN